MEPQQFQELLVRKGQGRKRYDFSIAETAAALNVSRKTVGKWRRRGLYEPRQIALARAAYPRGGRLSSPPIKDALMSRLDAAVADVLKGDYFLILPYLKVGRRLPRAS